MAPEPGRLSWYELAEMQAGVITVRDAMAAGVTRSEIRRRLADGSWRQPIRGVLVTDPGPPTCLRRAWCAVLALGPDAVLAGSAAATLDGLVGYDGEPPTVLVPASRRVGAVDGVIIRRTARLAPADIHPVHLPRRTTPSRSVIDMAEWAPGRDEARAVLRAAVAQGIVTVAALRDALSRRGPISRRTLIVQTLDDLDRATPHGLALLYRQVEDAFGLPPGRPLAPGPPERPTSRLDVWYGPWRLLVRLDTGQRAGAVPLVSHPLEEPVGDPAGEPRGHPDRHPGGPADARVDVPAGAGPAPNRAAPLSRRLVTAPTELLWTAPAQLAALVADALRAQGWTRTADVPPAPPPPSPPPAPLPIPQPSHRPAAASRTRPRGSFLRPVPEPVR